VERKSTKIEGKSHDEKSYTIMLAVLLLANTANAQTPDPLNKHAFITV
jgi:hypothetical protein